MKNSLLHFFFLLIFTIGVKVTNAHIPVINSIPTSEWIEEHKDSLRNTLLTNKTIIPDYENSILAALMFYPSLEQVNIKFKKRAITTSMAALPSAGSIFRKKKNRQYTIIINYKENKRKAPLIKDVPFQARVGVLGHELGHIVDYQSKSFIRIIANGIAYSINNNFRRNLEYKIDKIAINKGLGDGLYAFRLFIETEAETTNRYKKFKDRIYMSSAEIAQMIENLDNIANK
jgi:hypothetical protein